MQALGDCVGAHLPLPSIPHGVSNAMTMEMHMCPHPSEACPMSVHTKGGVFVFPRHCLGASDAGRACLPATQGSLPVGTRPRQAFAPSVVQVVPAPIYVPYTPCLARASINGTCAAHTGLLSATRCSARCLLAPSRSPSLYIPTALCTASPLPWSSCPWPRKRARRVCRSRVAKAHPPPQDTGAVPSDPLGRLAAGRPGIDHASKALAGVDPVGAAPPCVGACRRRRPTQLAE
jgi:hypothetical protein